MNDNDISAALQEQVRDAFESATPLCIAGGDSKPFYGRKPSGERIELTAHSGIVNYQPTELVITARAGTPLRVIEQALAHHNQMLAFEPPYAASNATLGGTIACNLSGPRRPYAGAARDFVLGAKIINGKGEPLAFGGEVMKNVAGYDVARLMCGAMGTLGVLLEVSLKVLPRPEQELSLVQEPVSAQQALERMHAWARLPLPVSATCYSEQRLYIRLSGTPGALRAARDQIGGELMDESAATEHWHRLTNHQPPLLSDSAPLWRLSLASDTAPIPIEGHWLYDWGGAQRWLSGYASAQEIRQAAANAGGHATLYRNGDQSDEPFQPLADPLMKLHRRLKQAFDPKAILNRGRMYKEF